MELGKGWIKDVEESDAVGRLLSTNLDLETKQSNCQLVSLHSISLYYIVYFIKCTRDYTSIVKWLVKLMRPQLYIKNCWILKNTLPQIQPHHFVC